MVVTEDGKFLPGVMSRLRVAPEPVRVRLLTKPGGLSAELVAVTTKLLAFTVVELTVNVMFVGVFSGVVVGPGFETLRLV